MKYRVDFIGSGYESVKTLYDVEATCPMHAWRIAEEMYEDNGWTFDYVDIEAKED